ncbi:dihydrofolate reductase [Aestuariispira ectoiniformans]|uniref:dihydrofolate reductase n=1 Tax=Aestuariispira ectoiniformans TaxID=2775080 RepID=UPI00223BAFA7|nr:dihydrofolate reductase [Aestuariispira ectoiniformans]
MHISLIVAMGRNNVIGVEGGLPWHIPGDLKFFKAQTLGKPIVMGRKTFESIGRPLPGRPNIVITRQEGYAPEGVEVVSTLRDALRLGTEHAERLGKDEVMIVGGAQIYAASLERADRLYITEVDAAPEGDAYFPKVDKAAWRESFREDHAAEGDIPAYSFLILDRPSVELN